MMLDELTLARNELARLQRKAQELIQQLLDVRVAVSAQRTKINELIRQRSPSIDCLPTELLLPILKLDISSLWTTVDVERIDRTAIRTYLKRSGGLPLHIVIPVVGWSRRKRIRFSQCLDIVMESCARRWRTIEVIDSHDRAPGDDRDSIYFMNHIVSKLKEYKFPSLKRIVMNHAGILRTVQLDFLSSELTPAIEHLELAQTVPSTELPAVSTLKTLTLSVNRAVSNIQRLSLGSLVSNRTLTNLALDGDVTCLFRETDLLELPLLQTLTLNAKGVHLLLGALVVPNLENLHYNVFTEWDLPSVVFRYIGSKKFTSVHHLSLSHLNAFETNSNVDYHSALTVCMTFPNVRHVELRSADMPHFFTPGEIHGSTNVPRPIDLWMSLESLTFLGLSPNWLGRSNAFTTWVSSQHSHVPRRLLRVNLAFGELPEWDKYPAGTFSSLYERLKEHCMLTLDFRLVPKLSLSGVTNSNFLPNLHIPMLTTELMDDLALAWLAGNVGHVQ